MTFHEPLHLIGDIKQFGAAIGLMASCCENNDIFFAKQPGKQAQKYHATFVHQTACHLIDKIIIHRAANHLELVCGDTPETLES